MCVCIYVCVYVFALCLRVQSSIYTRRRRRCCSAQLCSVLLCSVLLFPTAPMLYHAMPCQPIPSCRFTAHPLSPCPPSTALISHADFTQSRQTGNLTRTNHQPSHNQSTGRPASQPAKPSQAKPNAHSQSSLPPSLLHRNSIKFVVVLSRPTRSGKSIGSNSRCATVPKKDKKGRRSLPHVMLANTHKRQPLLALDFLLLPMNSNITQTTSTSPEVTQRDSGQINR